jgi:hypothetical protein
VRPHVSVFISPEALAGAPNWSPRYFVGRAAVALRAGVRGWTVGDLGGVVLEGWRVSQTPTALTYDSRASDTPIYRQSNIAPLRLLPSPAQWASPKVATRACVQPGDVILSKFVPIRAAIAPPAVRRHPVDGNSLIVRGLSRSAATWLAVCLNRSEYEQLLLGESAVLRRVGLRALTSLRLPPVPEGLDSCTHVLGELLDEMLLVGESIYRVQEEAAQVAASKSIWRNLREGTYFERESMSSDRWLPAAVDLKSAQHVLADEFGWPAVGSLASADSRGRLMAAPESARVLRLGDVTEDLFVGPGPEKSDFVEPTARRVLGHPLVAGEVLLSTQGTSFRIAYVDDDVARNTFPSDGWVRCRFRETPAAWALLLSTPHVRSQVARMAIGSVQQFVRPETLLSIHVPAPDHATRERWQRVVERHHAQRRVLDTRWNSLMASFKRLSDIAHGPAIQASGRAVEGLT